MTYKALHSPNPNPSNSFQIPSRRFHHPGSCPALSCHAYFSSEPFKLLFLLSKTLLSHVFVAGSLNHLPVNFNVPSAGRPSPIILTNSSHPHPSPWQLSITRPLSLPGNTDQLTICLPDYKANSTRAGLLSVLFIAITLESQTLRGTQGSQLALDQYWWMDGSLGMGRLGLEL